MSMLAERKRKQKWSLNPRGNLWVQDTNKFGKKMLEKMGWTDGKGLGANEDGAVEHVKVAYKNDSKGMGFKENGEQWTEHEDKFTSLLKSLAPNAAGEEVLAPSGKSLEEKSQKSRSRVHYYKFTRGKDLSRYSEKDLANIFGRKTLAPVKKPIDDAPADNGTQEGENKFGVDTVERGSMVDYFKQKFPLFSQRNSYSIGSDGGMESAAKAADSESESEERCGFGFSGDALPKSTGMSFVSYVKAEDTDANKVLAEDEDKDTSIGKEKRKKKKRKIDPDSDDSAGTKRAKLDDAGCVNPAFDPLSRNKIVGVKHSLTTIQEDEESEEITDKVDEVTPKATKKSKKQSPSLEAPIIEDEINCAEQITMENPYEVKRKSKKGSKKSNVEPAEGSSYCNPTLNFVDDCCSEAAAEEVALDSTLYEVKRKTKKSKQKISDTVQEDTSLETKKKKKSKKHEECGLDNPSLNISSIDNEDTINASQELEKKTKKKKKSKSMDGLDNPSLDDSLAHTTTKKKKSKSLEIGLDNPCLDTFDAGKPKKTKKSKSLDTGLNVEESEASPPKKSKSLDHVNAAAKDKKSKKAKSLDGLDNPGLNVDLAEESPTGLDETLDSVNTTQESVPSTKKKRKNKADTPKEKSVRFSNVNEEYIIPNCLDDGLDNAGFDLASNVVAEGVENMNAALDSFQNELENDMNERKLQELHQQTTVNTSRRKTFLHETEEYRIEAPAEDELEHGVVLKYSEGVLRKRTVTWRSDSTATAAKKGYKHLVRGDVFMHFKGSNIHRIDGYAAKMQSQS